MYNNRKLIRVKYYIIKLLYNRFIPQNADTKTQIQKRRYKNVKYKNTKL
jgi:hypothetical protein